MSTRMDIIRKVQRLRALAAHAGTGSGEATNATALADKLVAKHGLRESDFVELKPRQAGMFDGMFDGLFTDMDPDERQRIRNNVNARHAELEQLKKEAVNSVYRLMAFMQDDENRSWRDADVYKTLEALLKTAKGQLKKCAYCDQYGFGPAGLTERLTVGGVIKGGNKKYYDLHPDCQTKWLLKIKEHAAQQARIAEHLREAHGLDTQPPYGDNVRWQHQGCHRRYTPDGAVPIDAGHEHEKDDGQL